jgi:Leucine-rich repeat (LRR) protein
MILAQKNSSLIIKRLTVALVFLASCALFQADADAAIPSWESQALRDLFNSTNGANWIHNDGWMGVAGTECSWYGVTCNSTEAGVLQLNLRANLLTGSIPSTISNLFYLRNLDLGMNDLFGGIPTALGNLVNLQYLDLHSNWLSGSIPAELGNLANLQSLWLNSNQLTESIPANLGSLAALQLLDLSINNLSGSIPRELGNLTNLQVLYLYWDNLSGSIPRELGNLVNLQVLYLDNNQLSGSIPLELRGLVSLQWLFLSGNNLSGSIPPELGDLLNLQWLYLSGNNLSGSIPQNLGSLAALRVLDLSGNQLNGSIPLELGNLANLQYLWLYSNQISGCIPTQLTNLFSLTDLKIDYNALYATDQNLLSFLNSMQPGWQNTQTVAPANLTATVQSSSSVWLEWTPVSYASDAGRYEICTSTTSGSPCSASDTTGGKTATGYLATGLAPGMSYYFRVRTITDPHPNNKNTVTSDYGTEVSVGQPSSVTVTPASRDFGSIQVNTTADLTFTVQNSGGGTLSGTATATAPFSIVSGGSYTLTAGQSQTVTVRYSPASVGTHPGTVTFTGGGGASRSVTGSAYAAPAITVTPASRDFGSIQVNTTADLAFTVQNSGGGTLSGTATVTAPFSVVSGGSYTLTAGQSQTVTVRYSPISVGTHPGTVTFTGGGSASRSVTGSAYAPSGISVTPGNLDFGSIPVNTTADLPFTVQNIGGSTLSGTATVVAPFSIVSGGSYTLTAGQSQTVTVRYSPISVGTHPGTVTFTGGGGASRSVTGTAYAAPVITVTPASRDFGSIQVNTTADLTFTVQNSGGGTLSGTATVTAPFSVVSGGSYTLTAGQSQTVTVRYSPTSVDTHSGTVMFTGGGGVSRSVTGMAYSQPVISQSYVSLSQSVLQGQNAESQNFEVWNSGGGTLNYDIAGSATWLTYSPAGGSSTGERDTIQVIYSTSGLSSGKYNATITISATGAANGPQSVMVSLTVSEAMNPKPVITKLPSGVTAGGLTGFYLNVEGTDFVEGSEVRWDGETLSEDPNTNSTTRLSSQNLTVWVPASYTASAKVVKITAWNPEPGGGESEPKDFNVGAGVPVATELSLQSVIAGRSGYEVGIYGANFLPESIAEWNGLVRATHYVDSGKISIMLEAGDIAGAGTGKLTVMNPGVVRSNEKGLEVVALPAGSPEILRLVPDTVDAGGAGFTLVVEGSGYVPGSTVEWNGQGKVTKYGSGGQLSAEIPASDIARAAENYSVVVRNPVGGAVPQGLWPKDTGSGGSNTGVVSKRNPGPEVTGLSPAAVVAGSGGLQLRIIGGGYVEGKSMVSWNDVGLPSSYVSSTELRVDIPPGYVATGGTATIEVRNPSPGGGAMTKTFTILPNQEIKTILLYPRLVDVGGDGTSTESTSIVMANLSPRAAKITAWAYGQGGQEIQGENITNPVSMTMSPEEQRAAYDYHMFGQNFRQGGGGGWMKLESTEKQVAGFFMMFNDTFTYLDGANASLAGTQQFVFPEVADRGFTEIRVTNPTAGKANVTFELRKADGQMRMSAVLHPVEGSGTYAVQLSDLFAGVKPEPGDYVRASSDRDVVPLEYLGEKPKYVYALSGQEVAGGSRLLYGAQYAVVAGQWRTTISAVNLDALPGTVTFRLINDEGMQIGQTKSVAISAFGKVHVTDQDFFLGGDKSGYVEVSSDGPRLVGSVVFGDPDSEAMASSLPLTSGLMTSMVFGHAVSDDTWYTGITLVNPGVADADVTLSLYNTSGLLVKSRRMTISAGSRVVDVLSGSKLFPDLQGRNHYGYMTVTSNRGLAGFALFGTNDLNVLSAIPPQVVPAE